MVSARGGHSSGKGELSAEGEKARLGCPDVCPPKTACGPGCYKCTCTGADMHACTRTCTHTRACTHKHHTCVGACTHMHMYAPAAARACTHARAMHACSTHSRAYRRVCGAHVFTCACCREAKRSQLTMGAALPCWACHVAATQACRLSAGACWICCSLASMASRLLAKKLSVQRSSGSACGEGWGRHLRLTWGSDPPAPRDAQETQEPAEPVELARSLPQKMSRKHLGDLSTLLP